MYVCMYVYIYTRNIRLPAVATVSFPKSNRSMCSWRVCHVPVCNRTKRKRTEAECNAIPNELFSGRVRDVVRHDVCIYGLWVCLFLCFPICLSVRLSACLSDRLSPYLTGCLFVSARLPVCLSLSVSLPLCRSVSVGLPVCLSIGLLYVCLSVSVCLYVCLAVCLCVCLLYICLFVCLFSFGKSLRSSGGSLGVPWVSLGAPWVSHEGLWGCFWTLLNRSVPSAFVFIERFMRITISC